MNYPAPAKEVLLEKIHEMAESPWLFARNPDCDFTRKRKLDFETTLRFIITMESGNLKGELLEMFKFSPDTATSSALIQQREKIIPEAFAFLFWDFSKAFEEYKTYRGYRLLAIDGSDINIARDPEDKENHFQFADEKGFNQLHLNAMYDLVQ